MAAHFPSTDDRRVANSSDPMRLEYRVLTDREKELMRRVKEHQAQFVVLLHEIGGTGPAGDRFGSRNLSLAFTHAEDACYRAVKHITE
jgi:hypothetical protein